MQKPYPPAVTRRIEAGILTEAEAAEYGMTKLKELAKEREAAASPPESRLDALRARFTMQSRDVEEKFGVSRTMLGWLLDAGTISLKRVKFGAGIRSPYFYDPAEVSSEFDRYVASLEAQVGN